MNDTTARLTACVLLAGLAAAGCSSHKKATPNAIGATPQATGTAAASGAPTTGAGATSAPRTGGSAVPGASTTPGTNGQGTATSPGTAPSASASPTVIILNATLSKTCVRPGDALTLTLHARPKMHIVYNSGYADGQDGTVHGGKGGEHGANDFTDANGFWSTTWRLDPTTPIGEAHTTIAAVDNTGSGYKRLPFRVAASC